MSLIRRTARLERRLRSRAGRRSLPESQDMSMDYTLRLWQVYGRPGDPPPPSQPLTVAECEATLDAVYGPEAAPTPGSRRPCRARGHQPPPPYVVQWQRTGQVTHPLLRYMIAAYTGGQVVPDTFYQKPDPTAVEPESGAAESDPDDPGPDLPPAGPRAPPPESRQKPAKTGNLHLQNTVTRRSASCTLTRATRKTWISPSKGPARRTISGAICARFTCATFSRIQCQSGSGDTCQPDARAWPARCAALRIVPRPISRFLAR